VLGDSVLKIPSYAAPAPIEVIFSCDIDGILHIEVIDVTAGHSLGEFEIDRTSNLDRSEVDRMRDAMANMDVQ